MTTAEGGPSRGIELLVDMNLAPRWVSVLTDAGFSTELWSSLGHDDAPVSDCVRCNADSRRPGDRLLIRRRAAVRGITQV